MFRATCGAVLHARARAMEHRADVSSALVDALKWKKAVTEKLTVYVVLNFAL